MIYGQCIGVIEMKMFQVYPLDTIWGDGGMLFNATFNNTSVKSTQFDTDIIIGLNHIKITSRIAQSAMFCVVCYRSLFVFFPVAIVFVSHSSSYFFWLFLWYLQTFHKPMGSAKIVVLWGFFLFFLSSSCVHCVASFSGLSILIDPSAFSNV